MSLSQAWVWYHPSASGLTHNWTAITAGKSGISHIEHFEASDISSQIAGIIPKTTDENPSGGAFNADLFVEPKEQRKIDPFTVYALTASAEAIKDSGWMPASDEDKNRTGVMIGSGIGGLGTMDNTSRVLAERGPRRISPLCQPGNAD